MKISGSGLRRAAMNLKCGTAGSHDIFAKTSIILEI